MLPPLISVRFLLICEEISEIIEKKTIILLTTWEVTNVCLSGVYEGWVRSWWVVGETLIYIWRTEEAKSRN